MNKITDIYIYSDRIEFWRATRPFRRTYQASYRNVRRVMQAAALHTHTGRAGNTVRHYQPYRYDHES